MVGRALALIFLVLGVAGFGLCALCSGGYGLGMSRGGAPLIVLSLLMFGLTALCIWGIRVVIRRDRAARQAATASAPTPGP